MMYTPYRFLNTSIYRLLIIISLFFAYLISTSSKIYAQGTNNDEVKRLQRAIFVFNFAHQIGWPNYDTLDTFRIGVLEPDQIFLDLKSMAEKRKISGKSVEIIRFKYIKDVKGIQLLYVNNKYNYDVNYVLSKISGEHILLVTEDYDYNTSMINMVNVGDSFEYEINTRLIENEDFAIASSLKQYAVTSSQKWKGLFRTTEESLEKVLQKNEEQKEAIKNREELIERQEEKISSKEKALGNIEKKVNERNRTIKELWTESKISEKKYEEKLQIERDLEKSIKEQIALIKVHEDAIKKSSQEIKRQLKYQELQHIQIEKQDVILKEQVSEIDNQKKINALLIALAALIFIISFFVYRSYLNKRRLNAILEEKNKEIYKQSVILESKNKELEQFAYIASHDLQEPLNTISSFISLISEDYSDKFDEVGKESLIFIQDASQRMKKLISALLEYSRLGRTKEFTKVDVSKIIDEIKADFKTNLEKTKANIIIKGSLPDIKGSAMELRLLIQNLISNAIKFTEEDIIPKVTIAAVKKTYPKDTSAMVWEFSVKDNGIGIPEIHKDRIFAIFQRLHSREKYQGTGIGLAHCKKIVEAHGGDIWLESKEGEGTTFYFTIPI